MKSQLSRLCIGAALWETAEGKRLAEEAMNITDFQALFEIPSISRVLVGRFAYLRAMSSAFSPSSAFRFG